MKKYLNFTLISLLVLGFSTTSMGQKKIKEGVIKFEMAMEGEGADAMGMLGGSTMDMYFSEKIHKVDMNMMGGMMRMQTITPTQNPKDATILMDMMGQKIQLVEISEEEARNSNSFMDMSNVEKVEYDPKVRKEIAGYDCYLATVFMKNDVKSSYFITEKIEPLASWEGNEQIKLKGFPLEIQVNPGQGFTIIFKAKEVATKLPAGSFDIPSGYTKKTMAEFSKDMGGMKLGF
jgi:hypothetical protein